MAPISGHGKNPGAETFFHDTMIRIETNKLIVIIARHRKDSGEDIQYFFTMR